MALFVGIRAQSWTLGNPAWKKSRKIPVIWSTCQYRTLSVCASKIAGTNKRRPTEETVPLPGGRRQIAPSTLVAVAVPIWGCSSHFGAATPLDARWLKIEGISFLWKAVQWQDGFPSDEQFSFGVEWIHWDIVVFNGLVQSSTLYLLTLHDAKLCWCLHCI